VRPSRRRINSYKVSCAGTLPDHVSPFVSMFSS